MIPVSEFNEFEPRLKSAKNRFQLSTSLNLETLNKILSETNYIWLKFQPPLKFFKFDLRLITVLHFRVSLFKNWIFILEVSLKQWKKLSEIGHFSINKSTISSTLFTRSRLIWYHCLSSLPFTLKLVFPNVRNY